MGYLRLLQDQWQKPPWEFKIATGYGGRFRAEHKFGHNPTVGLTFEDIWSVGGNFSYLTSPETMEIDSTSAADASAGTGAQKIKIFGLDGGYKDINEEVTMNGTSNVTTTNSYLRITRMFITDVGSGDVNAGDIQATATTSSTIQGEIETDLGQSSMALATIPDGFYAILAGIRTAATGLDTATIDFQEREEGKGWRVLNRDNIPTATISDSHLMRFQAPILISPRSDLKIRGMKASAVGTTNIEASFSYYLIDEREINLV